MSSEAQITPAVARVLQEFLGDVSRPQYGYDLMEATGLTSRKLYPTLARLQHAGWLTRSREEANPSQAARPARYVYRLSPAGAECARQELAVLRAQSPVVSLRRLRPQVEGGRA